MWRPMSGFAFEKYTDYCLIRFTPDVSGMSWTDLDAATKRVGKLIQEATSDAVLVDLSTLERLQTGLLATIVQAWKEQGENSHRFVVVAGHQAVSDQLRDDGLAALWPLRQSLSEAFAYLGVSPQTDDESAHSGSSTQTRSQDACRPTSEASPESSPMKFQEQRGYCSVTLGPQLLTMAWADVEAATADIVEKLRKSERTSVMVDLSDMTHLNSGLVASLVRIWKLTRERHGQFSLVSPNDMVTEALKVAGLWKLWSVVDEREDAVYDLGVSHQAVVEKRERSLLVTLALGCSVVSALALIPMFMKREEVMGVNAQLTALLLAAAGLAYALLSALKESGKTRIISWIALSISFCVLSTLWFKENPISFGHKFPERDFNREDNEPSARSRDDSSTTSDSTADTNQNQP